MIIAFIGVDGTGKTTNSHSLNRELKEMGFSVEYRHEFEYFLLSGLVRSQSRMIESMRIKFHTNRSKPIYFRLWPFIVWLDSLIAWLFFRLFKFNKIIIHDRYIYDLLLAWERLGYSNDIVRRLYLGFPKPDLCFVLDVPPHVAYERKKETHSYLMNFYKVERRKYLNLAKILNFVVIDTRQPQHLTLQKILAEFRKSYFHKQSCEKILIAYMCSPSFNPSFLNNIDFKLSSTVNWDYIINFAKSSESGFYLVQNLLLHYGNELPSKVRKDLYIILQMHQERYARFLETLRIISYRFNENNVKFLLFKTPVGLKYIPRDIDIIVHENDFQRASRVLQQIYAKRSVSRSAKTVSYKNDILWPIDLHAKLGWFGIQVVDDEKIWQRARLIDVQGISLLNPSPEDEFLLVAAHLLFTTFRTDLSDLFYLKHLSEGSIDWGYIFSHAKRYDWLKSLFYFISFLYNKLIFLYLLPDIPLPIRPKRLKWSFLEPYFLHSIVMIPSMKKAILHNFVVAIFNGFLQKMGVAEVISRVPPSSSLRRLLRFIASPLSYR
jgi:thymidylate kinase